MSHGNTGIPTWRCKNCGGHDRTSVSIPEGIDFSVQFCEGCGIRRTDKNANGCMGWCCCVCDKCMAERASNPLFV